MVSLLYNAEYPETKAEKITQIDPNVQEPYLPLNATNQS
jgi:hypothetical protein